MFDEAPPANDAVSEDERALDVDMGFNHEELDDVFESVPQEQQKAKNTNKRDRSQPEKLLESDLDPWECYDPHDSSDVVLKPFKKGN